MDLLCPSPCDRSIAESGVRCTMEDVDVWSFSWSGHARMWYGAFLQSLGESRLDPASSHGGIACSNHGMAGLPVSLPGSTWVADVLH